MGHITRTVVRGHVQIGHSDRQAFAYPNLHYHKNWNKVRRTQISLINVYLSWFNTSPFLSQPLQSSFHFHTTPALTLHHSLHHCLYPYHPKPLSHPLSQCHFHLHTHCHLYRYSPSLHHSHLKLYMYFFFWLFHSQISETALVKV